MSNLFNIQIIGRVLIILLAMSLVGCSSDPPLETLEPEAAYRYLVKKFDKGHYLDVVDGLDFYTLNYSGTAWVDSAQFLLGETHYKLKQYLLGANAFDELMRRFPASPLVPDAMFRIGDCYWEMSPKYSLDQEFTLKAIYALQSSIDYYPNRTEDVQKAQELIGKCRDKLAHKTYSNGLIYLKMKDYTAAITYFKSVIDEYYDTDWASLSSFQMGVTFERDKQPEEAITAYRTFISKYSDHAWQDKAKSAVERLENSDGS